MGYTPPRTARVSRLKSLKITFFCLKNDDEKQSRKKYFEIPRAPSDLTSYDGPVVNLNNMFFLSKVPLVIFQSAFKMKNQFFPLVPQYGNMGCGVFKRGVQN